MAQKKLHFETLQLHVGQEQPDPTTDARAVPIYQTTSYVFHNSAHAAARFELKDAGNIYGRLTNPTQNVLEERLAALEGGVAALAVASGAAAVTYAFQNITCAGDHIVAAKTIYGGTYNLLDHTLPAYGVTATFVDPADLSNFEKAIRPNTKAVFIETLGNPNSNIIDIDAVAKIAHRHNIPLIIDNTAATAYLVKPLSLGADIVVNSTSKYINGNSNSISGVITDGGTFKWDTEKYPGMRDFVKFGPFAYTAKLRNGLFRNTGACLSPQNAFLNSIGLETLGLRMERICDNAMQLAAYIEENYKDITVNYAGLETSNWHEIAKSQFDGHYGGIFTLRLGSKERAFAFINALKYPLKVSNIGDTKTLVIHPESTISVHSTEEEKKAGGVFDDLVRVSVGIEDIDDLIWDFKQAIESLS